MKTPMATAVVLAAVASSSPVLATHECSTRSLSCNRSAAGDISIFDCTGDYRFFADYFNLSLQAGQTVTLDAGGFGVRLYDPTHSLQARNGLVTPLVYTAWTSGQWLVEVGGYPPIGARLPYRVAAGCENRSVPSSPAALKQLFGSSIEIQLGWTDTSTNEAGFVIDDGDRVLARVPANSTSAWIDPQPIGAEVRVRSVTANGESGGGAGPISPYDTYRSCAQGRLESCLGDRFRIEGDWTNQYSGATGKIHFRTLSRDAVAATFDNEENVEVIVKALVLDGRVKVFYSQLTDLQFRLRLRDTLYNKSEVYGNTPGNCGAIDSDAFKSAAARERLNRRTKKHAFVAGSCVASPSTLCLLNKRFKVEATWRNQYNGTSGTAGAIPLTELTGLLHYGSAANVELLVKTLDFGDRILFLYGALSDLGYTITLTDTVTNAMKTYTNPPGNYCGGIDRDAF